MELLELARNTDGAGVDFLREGVRVLAQALMDVEVTEQIGAEHGQRAPEQRTAQRNGYRDRAWDTRVGTVDLAIPRLRTGSYFPGFLDARTRAEKALCAVVAQCYIEGVSTRRVDDIARQMGIDGISKSQVSRICGDLDEVVAAWRNRPLDAGPYTFVWIDALTQKVREAGRVVNTAVLVATAVNAEGHREIIGLDIGSAENGATWTAFLRGLVARGLSGVRLVVSDAHLGLKQAIGAVLERRDLAAVPHPLRAQPADHRAHVGAADGRVVGAHDLRATTTAGRVASARRGHRQARPRQAGRRGAAAG